MQQNLEIVGTASAADADFLLAEISRTQPDAIIFSDAFARNHDELVLTLLNKVPDTKIITINLDDNRLNVISNKEITVKTTQDLVEAIIQ